ncbi:MAG: IS30 family transposase [Trueperaceae bacterium]|nr:IS30 family transposase [Trueperaceae bacterium]MCW5818318.1 IS30 family transposase [Trueperaceae bacterium]
MQVYFCDPHSPWQRGSNENTNGLLRQHFPHGIDFSNISETRLQEVEVSLNRRPRKTLDWRSPSEAYAATVAMTD